MRFLLILTVAVQLTGATAAVAGDCRFHPLWILELEVKKCEPLTLENSKPVRAPGGDDVEVSKALKTTPMLLVEAAVKRKRFAGDEAILPGKWEDADGKIEHFVMRTVSCGELKAGAVAKVLRPTTCNCDTGPRDMCSLRENAFIMPHGNDGLKLKNELKVGD